MGSGYLAHAAPWGSKTGAAVVGGPGVVPSDLGVLYLAVVWLLVLPVFRRGDSPPVWDRLEAGSAAAAYSSSGGFHFRGSHLGHRTSSDFSAQDPRFVRYIFVCVLCTCFSYV